MASVEDRVKDVVHRVLGVDREWIRPEHSFTEDLGAESVQSVELVAAFEEAFELEMDEEGALEVQTVGGAVDYIRKQCEEQGIEV